VLWSGRGSRPRRLVYWLALGTVLCLAHVAVAVTPFGAAVYIWMAD